MSRHSRRSSALLAVLALIAAVVVAPVQQAQAQAFSVLVFSKTEGFRHDSIPAGLALHHRRRAQPDPAGRLRALRPRGRRLRGHAVTGNNIVLAQTTDTSRIDHFNGLYTYDAIAGATAPGWEQAGEYAKANGLIWAPSVGPGYLDDRAVPGNTTPTLGRDNGATYDLEWNNALDPTKGAYGKTGAAAETAYLDRTAYWAAEFEERRGGVPPVTNLALNRPATADSQCAASEGAEKAVNGSVFGGNSDKWCSLGASKWLRVDLGPNRQVGRFVLKHAGSGGEPAAFNTRDFDLQTSVDGLTWTTVFALAATRPTCRRTPCRRCRPVRAGERHGADAELRHGSADLRAGGVYQLAPLWIRDWTRQ